MSLKDLTNLDSGERKLLSWMILENNKYLEEVEKGLPFFTKEELFEIEENEEYKKGIPFSELNKILSAKGMILKLPTFKKYVTLKLIPDSVGTQKTDKGIVGLYPPKVIRAINFVKYSLYANLDFEPIVDRFFDQFKTTVLELIESSFPGNMWLEDFFGEGPINKRNETVPEAIRRYIDELYEQKIIKKQKMEEINDLVETIIDSMWTARDNFHSLKNVLGEISIPGQIGFSMIASETDS